MEDGPLRIERLAVSVRGSGRVEALRQLELGLGRNVGLLFEDENLVSEQGVVDRVKVGI